MIQSPGEIDEIFNQSFPRQVQQALLQSIFSTYGVAFEECSRFPEEEARDFRGLYRWIQLRAEWRGLPDRFPQMSASAEQYHTLLTGGQVKLTACSLRQPVDSIRFAYYRLEYALESNLDLFTPPAPMPDDAFLYALLIHGVDPLEPRQPGFARVVFPGRDLQTRIYEIDLFARFADLTQSLRGAAAVTMEVLPEIRIRRNSEESEG